MIGTSLSHRGKGKGKGKETQEEGGSKQREGGGKQREGGGKEDDEEATQKGEGGEDEGSSNPTPKLMDPSSNFISLVFSFGISETSPNTSKSDDDDAFSDGVLGGENLLELSIVSNVMAFPSIPSLRGRKNGYSNEKHSHLHPFSSPMDSNWWKFHCWKMPITSLLLHICLQFFFPSFHKELKKYFGKWPCLGAILGQHWGLGILTQPKTGSPPSESLDTESQ